ncbi:MAG TPA: NAD(P)/FAD-dependent oxidoreductase [Solirubrobacteraceae bacterium]|nr:NAD(P)/FAD-dependent oxidoreductase [Solirubrobacteraceae bacterium]
MIDVTPSTSESHAPSRDEHHAVIVVGGGPGGLAVAAELRRVRIPTVVVEQADALAATWRGTYDRLRLNTSRLTSRLPGARYPRGSGMFPSRDQFVTYLERYAERANVEVRLGVRVERIDRGRLWRVRAAAHEMHAEHVVIASGYAREPFVPAWPGRDRFKGRLLHASEYRNARQFRDCDVLVAGCGSSGMEIAYDLATNGAARVRLAVRTPPNIVLRSLAGVPGDPLAVAMLKLPTRIADAQMRLAQRVVLGDLSAYGLPAADEGPFTRLARTGAGPAVIDREIIDAVKQGLIEIVSGVEALDETAVTLAAEERVEPDAIIAATGYRPALQPIVGHLGVLDEHGIPRVVGGHEAVSGLRFVGFRPVPGQIRLLGIEARTAAREIARSREQLPAPRAT